MVLATIERKREAGWGERERERLTQSYMGQRPRVGDGRKEGHKAGKLAMWSWNVEM